jgi:hypothetical protein
MMVITPRITAIWPDFFDIIIGAPFRESIIRRITAGRKNLVALRVIGVTPPL